MRKQDANFICILYYISFTVKIVVPENALNLDVVHQDDDGFESLNGNVSSDNDRGNARIVSRDDNDNTPDIGSPANFDELITSSPVNISEHEKSRDRCPPGSLSSECRMCFYLCLNS